MGCKFSLKVFGDGEPVIATEGWKDAFRIHLETGETTVALPSVSAYRIIPSSVEKIVYDADAAHRGEVLTRIALPVVRFLLAAEMRELITEWEQDAAG